MEQISNHVFCNDFIASLELETRLMPNPYYDYPYLLIPGFLSPEACRMIVDHTHALNDAETAAVKQMKLGSVVQPEVDTSIRKTKVHKLPDELLAHYQQRFIEHQAQIERFFALALTTSTTVQTLEYQRGDFYIKHADDSSEIVDADKETIGFVPVAPQRKITSVLFLTSHSACHDEIAYNFDGGELLFNYLSDEQGETIMIKPVAGDMILFPSNPIFSHEVLPVRSGFRLTMVQWHNAIIN